MSAAPVRKRICSRRTPGCRFELYPNQQNEKIFRNVIQTGEAHYARSKPFEYAENPERGVTHWDWSLVPLKDPGGRVTGAVLSLLNVTTRINVIEELHASEEALRTFLDSLTLEIELSVSDDRVGLPPGLDPDVADTMGLRLVAMLCRQLGGRMETRSDSGTSISVIFPSGTEQDKALAT